MAIHADTHDDLRLFQTGEHACGYWSERRARDLVLDPHDPRLGAIYPQALAWGFRRS
ncbi:MAG: arginyltransferase, partial [Xanthomonas perforans]|nr:arginyltransferase [Xanthomonas perforans]NEL81469.1 arginyltransferase [Xanthomonas perforans]